MATSASRRQCTNEEEKGAGHKEAVAAPEKGADGDGTHAAAALSTGSGGCLFLGGGGTSRGGGEVEVVVVVVVAEEGEESIATPAGGLGPDFFPLPRI